LFPKLIFFLLISSFKKEEKNQAKSGEAKDVRINGVFPPIEKMDASLSTLVNCE
jgi:dynein light chain 1